MDDTSKLDEREELPFTGGGHPFFRRPGVDAAMPAEALPPKHNLAGSPANYWLLDEAIIANMQIVITPLDQSVPVFKMPHAVVEGVVEQVISEQDGDHHLWVNIDGGKSRFACEITPQQPIPPPKVGDHVRVYGIFRYDAQHGWFELHPVDAIENI